MTASRALIWPVLLIAAGIALLLANLGYLPPVEVGRVITRLWPLILVVVGLELALSRRSPGIALGLQVAVIVAALGVVAAQPSLLYADDFVGDSSVEVARDGATSATLRVSLGAGRFQLTGGATELLTAESDEPDLRVRTDRDEEHVTVRLDQQQYQFNAGPTDVRAHVASDIPMTIRVDAGAGEFTLDLSEIEATDVNISVGAASLTVVLPRPAGDVPVSIRAGASSVDIEIPDGVEAKVTTRGALVAITGRTETPGYSAATDRVTVTVEAGASSVDVR